MNKNKLISIATAGAMVFSVGVPTAATMAAVPQTAISKTAKIDISDFTVSGLKQTYDYKQTFKALTPNVTVRNGKEVLRPYYDYQITYLNNNNVGVATVIIKGVGRYTGEIRKTFNITTDIGNVKKTGLTNDRVYTKPAVTPVPVLSFNGIKLVQDKDYTVSYKNNTKAGIATIEITGKGNFTGTYKTFFKIKQSPLSKAKAVFSNNRTSYPYTGQKIWPGVTVTLNGETLEEDKDYAVSYSNNKEAGTASVTIKGINNYYGTIVKNFEIVKPAVKAENVTVQAVDIKTGEKVKGYALLKVYDAKMKYIGILSIKNGECTNPSIFANEGAYCLKELTAPKGYTLGLDDGAILHESVKSNTTIKLLYYAV